MRLDVFLKLSRLIPRRTLAKEFASAGLVTINDLTAKSSSSVHVGDVIRINRRNSRTSIEVLEVPSTKQVSKKNASNLYKLLAREELDPLVD